MRAQRLASVPILALVALVACGSNTRSALPGGPVSLPVGSAPAADGGGPVVGDEAELRRRADAIGNVLLASVRPWGDEASLVAVDLETGKPYWQTTNLALSSFVAQDGYLIGSTEGLGKKPELVVLEADTGRVVSRTTTPHAVPSFANLLARDGTTLWALNVINTVRLAVE